MLVPTIPLIEQQTAQLCKYCAGKCRVDNLSGADVAKGRAKRFLAHDLLIMTPQILL